jgi:hypothetical protein
VGKGDRFSIKLFKLFKFKILHFNLISVPLQFGDTTMYQGVEESIGEEVERKSSGKGSRASSQAWGIPGWRAERATIPQAIAQVVSMSPKPLIVAQKASS